MTGRSAGAQKGVVVSGSTPELRFVVDGREAADEVVEHWTLDRHGFAFLTGRPSSLSRETFLATPAGGVDYGHPGGPLGDCYTEVQDMARALFPAAEHVRVTSHTVRRSGGSGGCTHHASPKVPGSKAHQMASRMVHHLNYVDYAPADAKRRWAERVHARGAACEEAFLRESVETQAMALTENQYALMPGAGPDLQAEVLALLRDDEHYGYVARARRCVPAPGSEGDGAAPDAAPDSGPAGHAVPPKDPDSKAHQVAAGIVRSVARARFRSEPATKRIASQLHEEGVAGEKDFLDEIVAEQAMPLSENLYALMPGATSELQAEVLALLRDDADYDFVSRMRGAVPKLQAGEVPKVFPEVHSPGPPAFGVHTDVGARGWYDQFRRNHPRTTSLGSVPKGFKRRVLFLKFWRGVNPETPIVNHHLAMLDKGTVNDRDISEAEIAFKGFLVARYNLAAATDEGRRWVYFPGMQHDEVLCFVQGDLTLRGAGPAEVTFPPDRRDHSTFHTAFEDPGAPPDAPPRESVEAGVEVFLPLEAEAEDRGEEW